MQSLILHHVFLINWHYFVEICFHIDIKGFFFCQVLSKTQITLTTIQFIKVIKEGDTVYTVIYKMGKVLYISIWIRKLQLGKWEKK